MSLRLLSGGHSFLRSVWEGRCNAPKPGNWRDACQRFPDHEGMHMSRWSRWHTVHGWHPGATNMAFHLHNVPRVEWEGTGVPLS